MNGWLGVLGALALAGVLLGVWWWARRGGGRRAGPAYSLPARQPRRDGGEDSGAWLCLLDEAGQVEREFPLSATTRLGRDPARVGRGGGIVLPAETVSGWHCTLVEQGGEVLILDEASANGTYVNGRRVPAGAPRPLQDGDLVELAPAGQGGVRFRVHLPAHPDDDAPAPREVPTRRVPR